MTAKHTPGPWGLTDDDSPLVYGTHAYIAQVFSRTNADIGTLRDHYAADARLIAAAPDLLAALGDLLDDLQMDMLTAPAGSFRMVKSGRRIEQARAAITRATGGMTS